MYRLATMHSVTDRRTYDIMMPIVDHIYCVLLMAEDGISWHEWE